MPKFLTYLLISLGLVAYGGFVYFVYVTSLKPKPDAGVVSTTPTTTPTTTRTLTGRVMRGVKLEGRVLCREQYYVDTGDSATLLMVRGDEEKEWPDVFFPYEYSEVEVAGKPQEGVCPRCGCADNLVVNSEADINVLTEGKLSGKEFSGTVSCIARKESTVSACGLELTTGDGGVYRLNPVRYPPKDFYKWKGLKATVLGIPVSSNILDVFEIRLK